MAPSSPGRSQAAIGSQKKEEREGELGSYSATFAMLGLGDVRMEKDRSPTAPDPITAREIVSGEVRRSDAKDVMTSLSLRCAGLGGLYVHISIYMLADYKGEK